MRDIDDLADETAAVQGTVFVCLKTEPGERAFALARRMALSTNESTELVVFEDETVVARTSAPIATASSLITLKAVAIPHRSHRNHPEKVGSDIHDLVLLFQSCDVDETVDSMGQPAPSCATGSGRPWSSGSHRTSTSDIPSPDSAC